MTNNQWHQGAQGNPGDGYPHNQAMPQQAGNSYGPQNPGHQGPGPQGPGPQGYGPGQPGPQPGYGNAYGAPQGDHVASGGGNKTPWIIGIGVVVVALIVGAIWFFTRDDSQETREANPPTPASTATDESTTPTSNTTAADPSTNPVDTEVAPEPATTPADTEVTSEPAATPLDTEVAPEPATTPAEGSDQLPPYPSEVGGATVTDPDSDAGIFIDPSGVVYMVTVFPGIGTEGMDAALNDVEEFGAFTCGHTTDDTASSCFTDQSSYGTILIGSSNTDLQSTAAWGDELLSKWQ